MKARLLLPALAFLAGPLAAQDNDPPARAGRVSSVAGTVAFQAAGSPDWAVTPLNYTVTSGDRLLTHRQSRAEIEVGPFAVRLADSTDLSVVNLTDDFTQLGLSRGSLRVSVYRLASRDSMEIDTPNGAMIIRSAGRYRVDVLDGVSTIVSVEDGVAYLSGPALDYTVKRGQSVELTGTAAISASMVPHPASSDFDQWSSDRDQRETQSTCSRYMSQDIPGCADLSANGSWEYQGAYGYVWRPRIVNVGWVPYRYGRWVWTGPWGYSWVEDAPWGYAPFHYGRWVTVSGAWVWAPGPIIRRPCYAPALVVFVGGPRYGRYHQAWFPLGWREPYYPRYRHSDRYLREVNIANVRSISNVNEFVDVRRADRIDYAHRQATTVVSNEVFGRRQAQNEVTTPRPEGISRAPILREPWGSGQLPARLFPATRVGGPARVSDPGRVSEPVSSEPQVRGVRSPLIFRNAPPLEGRRAETPANDGAPTGTIRSRGLQQVESSPVDRGRPVIRRATPSQLPAAGGSEPAERPRGGIIARSGGADRSFPQRTETSRPSSESRPQRTGASRPSSGSGPRERSPGPIISRGAQRASPRPPR